VAGGGLLLAGMLFLVGRLFPASDLHVHDTEHFRTALHRVARVYPVNPACCPFKWHFVGQCFLGGRAKFTAINGSKLRCSGRLGFNRIDACF